MVLVTLLGYASLPGEQEVIKREIR